MIRMIDTDALPLCQTTTIWLPYTP